jgi:hypothetical protein
MRKQRTREHVIEDLGFNYVERQILYAGFTVQRYTHNDYGYDGLIHTFNEYGEVESDGIYIQLKSTDNILFSEKTKTIAFDLSKRDLELWLKSIISMLLIVYDGQKEEAYFMDLQAYFREKEVSNNKSRKFVRIHIPKDNVFTANSIQLFNKNNVNGR